MAAAKNTGTLSTSAPSEVLLAVAEAIDRAQAAFAQGKYDAAAKAMQPPRKGDGRAWYYGWNEWEQRFEQEIRERKTPVLDYEAIILGKIEEACKTRYAETLPWGLDPRSLSHAAEGDTRWDRQEATRVLQRLFDAKRVELHSKVLWTPEAWKKRTAMVSEKAKTTRRKAKAENFKVVL